jgi:hypothetical protein
MECVWLEVEVLVQEEQSQAVRTPPLEPTAGRKQKLSASLGGRKVLALHFSIE